MAQEVYKIGDIVQYQEVDLSGDIPIQQASYSPGFAVITKVNKGGKTYEVQDFLTKGSREIKHKSIEPNVWYFIDNNKFLRDSRWRWSGKRKSRRKIKIKRKRKSRNRKRRSKSRRRRSRRR